MMKLFSKNAVKFSGLGSNCTMDNYNNGSIKNQLTIRVRFKVISQSNNYEILKKENEYKLLVNENNQLEFAVYDGSDWELPVIAEQLEINKWYDIICTISINGNMIYKSIYMNSENNIYSEITQVGNISQTINPLVIGNSEIIIDNVMIWDKVLDAPDIKILYNGGIYFPILNFWVAFEDLEDTENNETIEVIYKRNKGLMSNYELVSGKEYEETINSTNKILVVKKW